MPPSTWIKNKSKDLRNQYDTWRVFEKEKKHLQKHPEGQGKMCIVTSSAVVDHTPRSHCEEESGDDRRPVRLDMGHHKDAEEAEAERERHKDHRRVDVEAGNPPSEAAGECDVHSHLHSTLGGRGLGTVHGSDPGDYIHGAQGIFARNHPWEDRADEGNGTGRDHGKDGLLGSGSGTT